MKERIARWYTLGLWTAEMVNYAAAKEILTQEEAEQILNPNVQEETE